MSQFNRGQLRCPNCSIEPKTERHINYEIHNLPYEGQLVRTITCRKCEHAEEVDKRVDKW